MIRLAIILFLLPAPLFAQSLRERVDSGTTISLPEWDTLTRGKTVIYQSYGVEVGREYYPPSGNQVFYKMSDGNCLEGVVSYVAPLFCFDWVGLDQMCFEHKYVDNQIFVINAQGAGIIFVAGIVQDPFRCSPGLMSRIGGSDLLEGKS